MTAREEQPWSQGLAVPRTSARGWGFRARVPGCQVAHPTPCLTSTSPPALQRPTMPQAPHAILIWICQAPLASGNQWDPGIARQYSRKVPGGLSNTSARRAQSAEARDPQIPSAVPCPWTGPPERWPWTMLVNPRPAGACRGLQALAMGWRCAGGVRARAGARKPAAWGRACPSTRVLMTIHTVPAWSLKGHPAVGDGPLSPSPSIPPRA